MSTINLLSAGTEGPTTRELEQTILNEAGAAAAMLLRKGHSGLAVQRAGVVGVLAVLGGAVPRYYLCAR